MHRPTIPQAAYEIIIDLCVCIFPSPKNSICSFHLLRYQIYYRLSIFFLVFSKILNVLFSKKAMSADQKTIMIIPFGDKNPRRQDNLSTGTFFIKYYKQICRRQRRPRRRRGNGHRHTSIFRKLCFFSGVALFIAICCPLCAPSKKGARRCLRRACHLKQIRRLSD